MRQRRPVAGAAAGEELGMHSGACSWNSNAVDAVVDAVAKGGAVLVLVLLRMLDEAAAAAAQRKLHQDGGNWRSGKMATAAFGTRGPPRRLPAQTMSTTMARARCPGRSSCN